jgi:hypothetical protein
MYWCNPKSEFYGVKLEKIGPIRFRLTMLKLTIADFLMEQWARDPIFWMHSDD